MSSELLTTLSDNFMRLLEYADDYNVLIRVGEAPSVHTFKAHSIVLRARSTYFKYALSSEWATMEGNMYTFTKPNISPESFEIILSYIYGGKVDLNKFDGENIIKLLVAADELCLSELLDYVQDYFVINGNNWLLENINDYCHIIFQHDNFKKLQQTCINMVSKVPQKFRKHGKFMKWPENLIIGILKRDDLHLEEIDVWNILIKWGTAQTNLSQNYNDWTSEDFSKLTLKLKDCIPYIRFYHISGADFYNHVIPYRILIPEILFNEIYHFHYYKIDNPQHNILPPRGIALDSTLIGSRHAALIASWVDRQENFNPSTCHLVPYQFNLLLRGSQDSFKCSTFHKLCDNKGPALVVLKVKGTRELLGGYNPTGWNSSGTWIQSEDSFIFSLGDGKDPAHSQAVLSRIKNDSSNCAIDDSPCIGPCFGVSDLVMVESSRHANGKFIYDLPWNCIQNCYERPITSTTNFAIEDYEVFELTQKTNHLE